MPPYLALLRAGFCLPPVLPRARCALTAPFHPYLRESGALEGVVAHAFDGRHYSVRSAGLAEAVYFLCHFPSGHPARALPGALPCGVRTFLSFRHFTARRLSEAAVVWPAATIHYRRSPAASGTSPPRLNTKADVQAALDRCRAQPVRAVVLCHGVDASDVEEVLELRQCGGPQTPPRHGLREPRVSNLVVLLIDSVRLEKIHMDLIRIQLASGDRSSRYCGVDHIVCREERRNEEEARARRVVDLEGAGDREPVR